MNTKERFQGRRNVWLHEFSQVVLVQCPQCGHCAQVTRGSIENKNSRKDPSSAFRNIRFLCTNCGSVKSKREPAYANTRVKKTQNFSRRNGQSTIGVPSDPYFGFPLYLQASCCGHTFWAFNLAHLRYLEDYIQAELRECGYTHYRSVISRLPKWMKSAKHRDEVLRCIGKVKASLVEK